MLLTKTGKASAAGQSTQVEAVFYLLKTTEGGSSSKKWRIDFIQSRLLHFIKITQIYHKENHQQSHYCQRGLYRTARREWGNTNWSFHVSVFYCIFRGLNSPNRFGLITLRSDTCICCGDLGGTDDECVCVCFHSSPRRSVMEIWSQTATEGSSVITRVSLRRWMRAHTAADETDRDLKGKWRKAQQEVKLFCSLTLLQVLWQSRSHVSSSDMTNTKATERNPAPFLSCLIPAAEHSPGRHGYSSFLPGSLPMHRLWHFSSPRFLLVLCLSVCPPLFLRLCSLSSPTGIAISFLGPFWVVERLYSPPRERLPWLIK